MYHIYIMVGYYYPACTAALLAEAPPSRATHLHGRRPLGIARRASLFRVERILRRAGLVAIAVGRSVFRAALAAYIPGLLRELGADSGIGCRRKADQRGKRYHRSAASHDLAYSCHPDPVDGPGEHHANPDLGFLDAGTHEVVFYTVLTALLLLPERGRMLGLVLLHAAICLIGSCPQASSFLPGPLFFANLWPVFGLGLAVALAPRDRPVAAAVGLISLLAVLHLLGDKHYPGTVYASLVATTLVAVCASGHSAPTMATPRADRGNILQLVPHPHPDSTRWRQTPDPSPGTDSAGSVRRDRRRRRLGARIRVCLLPLL